MIKEYYICSKENININLEWSTDNFSVRFTHKEKLPYDISKKVNNYITSVGMYGRYDISQKNKKANYNTNKDIKALGLKLNNWIFSPTNSSFIGNESESIFSKSKNAKEIFFIRFHAKF